jgi:hypothetical protein
VSHGFVGFSFGDFGKVSGDHTTITSLPLLAVGARKSGTIRSPRSPSCKNATGFKFLMTFERIQIEIQTDTSLSGGQITIQIEIQTDTSLSDAAITIQIEIQADRSRASLKGGLEWRC